MRKALDGQMPSQEKIEQEIVAINAAVDRFAGEMKKVMIAKAQEGRHGWNDPTLEREIYNDMLAHAVVVEKTPGKEVHVANFAMMLHLIRNRAA